MPRDVFPIEPRRPDLRKPSLEGLVYILRHPEEWPPRFEWHWADCWDCGLGLALRRWDTRSLMQFHQTRESWLIHGARLFDLTCGTVEYLFFESRGLGRDPTPEGVADRIENYLDRRAMPASQRLLRMMREGRVLYYSTSYDFYEPVN